jgi:hypothetical protein
MRQLLGMGLIGADPLNRNGEQGNDEAIGKRKGTMPSGADGATGSTSQNRYHPYARRKHPYDLSHPPCFESSTYATFLDLNIEPLYVPERHARSLSTTERLEEVVFGNGASARYIVSRLTVVNNS